MENSGSKRSLRSWSITEKGKLDFEMIGSNLGVKSLELSENRIGCRVWVKRDPHIRSVLDNSF